MDNDGAFIITNNHGIESLKIGYDGRIWHTVNGTTREVSTDEDIGKAFTYVVEDMTGYKPSRLMSRLRDQAFDEIKTELIKIIKAVPIWEKGTAESARKEILAAIT